MAKLKKCKKCKVAPISKEIKLAEHLATVYLYQCPECGISTDPYWTSEEAQKAWNKGEIDR